MTPTEILEEEHELILRVLDVARREVQSIQDTGAPDRERLEKMIDFFRNFADRCHHAKEEKHLFIRMRARGLPAEGGPVAVMLHEHELGLQFVAAVADALPRAFAGDVSAVKLVADNLASYAELLRAHIMKENSVLFPLANRILTPEDQEELLKEFARIESEEMGEGAHEKYHQLAHDLMKD